MGSSIPPYQTRFGSITGFTVSTVRATRAYVCARSTVMAAWAAKPYPKVRIVAVNRVRPRICILSARDVSANLQRVRRSDCRKGCIGFRLDDFWTVIQRTKNRALELVPRSFCNVMTSFRLLSTRHRLLARRKTHAPRFGNLIAANRALD